MNHKTGVLYVCIAVCVQTAFFFLMSAPRTAQAQGTDDRTRQAAAVARCQVEDDGIPVVGYNKVVCVDPKAIKWTR